MEQGQQSKKLLQATAGRIRHTIVNNKHLKKLINKQKKKVMEKKLARIYG